MKYSNIHLIYFSPTHTSAKIVYAIAEGMGATSMSESDVTCESLDMEEYIDDELTIIAAPVYGGRVAETAMERFRMFRSAHHAPVVPVVLYGNRDYEDALKELCDLVSEQGFVPVAAGAFIGEHSFSRKGMPIAEGRPDESDLNHGEVQADLVEVMSCRTGCVGGAGQPYALMAKKLQRAQGLYEIDRSAMFKRSERNPVIDAMYANGLADRAHELLHIEYKD